MVATSRQYLFFCLLLVLAQLTTLAHGKTKKAKVLKGPSKIPSEWKKVGKATSKQAMNFNLYLNAPNRDGLDAYMEQIAQDPSLPWLNASQLASYITPSKADQTSVTAALTAVGIPAKNLTWSSLGDRVTVKTTVKLAGKFFNTTIINYSHDGQTTVPKADNVTIASTISSAVYSVGNLMAYGVYATGVAHTRQLKASKRRLTPVEDEDLTPRGLDEVAVSVRDLSSSTPPSTCYSSGGSVYTYPRCLIDYLGLPQPKKSLKRRNDLAIVGYLAENVSQSDLRLALKNFRPDQPNAANYNMYLEDLFGAVTDGNSPSAEAALDTQVTAGMVYPLQTSYYNFGDVNANTPGSDTGDIFLTAFEEFIEQDATTRPSVISVSYGILDESAMTSTMAAMCNAAQTLSAMGTTIIFASGDSGPDGPARAYSPEYPDAKGCPTLKASYPNGCPYILSVGATSGFGAKEQPVYYGIPSAISGYAWQWATGSGVSKLWSTPSWQSSYLSTYLAGSNSLYSSKTSGQFSTTGRAFPDVVTVGVNYPSYEKGGAILQAGTSMSAPVMASMIAVLNDLLLNAGKATVGWAHPMFYANPSAFKDIATGGSWWKCGTAADTLGFNATTGFDVATGLGAVDFTKLRALYGV